MHLSVQTHAQPGPSRPVTFALPPSPRLREDGLLATGFGTTPPVTPPAFDRSNPFNSSTSSAAASPSGASFLSRLSRKLSVGKSSLSRSASSRGSRRQDEPESPRMARGVSFAEPTKPESTPPCECVGSNADSNVAPPAPLGRRGSTGLGLRRGLRVGNRRATGDQISSRGSAERTVARETRQRTPEVHSNLGSYFWSDSLGVCWDGRERVHPDLLFVAQPYTSDADFIPVPQAQTSPSARVVYASTLSSFPPRPPLRPRSPELSPAAQIIAEYRGKHGTLTPSIRSLDLGSAEEADEETGASTVTAPTIRPPSPVLRTLRIAIDDFAPAGARTDSPVSTRSSTSQDARKLFAYASPGGHGSPADGDGEDGHRATVSRAESDTSVEDDQMSTSGPAAPVTKPAAITPPP
ncbi:hypothetical protein RHOSPDRAFT_34698 [Rhodotorula sp. JG-1b]|nr:hypothetical protein RHOSPDRAFT_34698 [Rhodotorula sp. JG-1b]